MNLLNQLTAASSPVPIKPNIEHIRKQNLLLGGQAKRDKAVAAYKAVMQGQGWLTQRQIEGKLGYAMSSSTPFLVKARELGYVERRNKGGAVRFSRTVGYEWRWL